MPRGFSCSSDLCSLYQFQVQNTQGSQMRAAKISSQLFGCLPLVCWDTGFLTQFWMSAYAGLLAICHDFTGNSDFLTLLMGLQSPFLCTVMGWLVLSPYFNRVSHREGKAFLQSLISRRLWLLSGNFATCFFFYWSIIASQRHVQQSASAVWTHISPPLQPPSHPALPTPPGQHTTPAEHPVLHTSFPLASRFTRGYMFLN